MYVPKNPRSFGMSDNFFALVSSLPFRGAGLLMVVALG